MTVCELCNRPTYGRAAADGAHPCCRRFYRPGRGCFSCAESAGAAERWKAGAPARAARAKRQAELEAMELAS